MAALHADWPSRETDGAPDSERFGGPEVEAIDLSAAIAAAHAARFGRSRGGAVP